MRFKGALLLSLFAFFALTIACKTPAEPVAITVDATDAKYWYVSGTEIDPEGLMITATMSDGTSKTIPASECTFEKPKFMPYGEKSVIVHYGELSADYSIYTCPSMAETEKHTTYTIRKNDNGHSVSLTASLVGDNKPFVLILPGGAYAAANYGGSEGCGYADRINELGYNAFVLEYSVLTKHPAPLEDVAMAYEIIEQNRDFFNVSMENYAVCGSSAGGHLAGTWCSVETGFAQYGKPRPAAAILAYPLISFVNKNSESLSNLVGDSPSEELLHALSVEEHVDADFPPTYAWIFVEDSLIDDTKLIEQTLSDANIRHMVRYFNGGRHGLGLAPGTEAEGWMDEAVEFWQSNLRKEG